MSLSCSEVTPMNDGDKRLRGAALYATHSLAAERTALAAPRCCARPKLTSTTRRVCCRLWSTVWRALANACSIQALLSVRGETCRVRKVCLSTAPCWRPCETSPRVTAFAEAVQA
jgi:hypothetical protein